MGSRAGSKSSVRFALFSAGTLLLHGAAAWALPARAPQIDPIPLTFSLIEPPALEAAAPGPGAGLLGTQASSPGAAWPSKAEAQTKASRVRKRGLADTRAGSVGESLHASSPRELSPQQEAPTPCAASQAGEVGAMPGADSAGTSTALGAAAGSSAATGSAPGEAGASTSGTGRAPALLAAGDLCAPFFPDRAEADRGEVQIEVEVDAGGHAHASAVLIEAPLNQGFASAARECARRLRFAPAMSESGAPVIGHAKLKLRFKRRTA